MIPKLFIAALFLVANLFAACSPPDHIEPVYLPAPERDNTPAPSEQIHLAENFDFHDAWLAVGGTGPEPKVHIVEDRELNCGSFGFWVDWAQTCVWGWYEHATDTIHVTRHDLWMRYPHEARHAAKMRATGNPDSEHGGFVGWDIVHFWDREYIEPGERLLHDRGWR